LIPEAFSKKAAKSLDISNRLLALYLVLIFRSGTIALALYISATPVRISGKISLRAGVMGVGQASAPLMRFLQEAWAYMACMPRRAAYAALSLQIALSVSSRT